MFFVRQNNATSRSIVLNKVRMFFVRQNEATSRSIVLNTLALAYIETLLISRARQAEDRPGEKGIREMSRETERTSDSRLKVNNSHIVTYLCRT